MIMKSRHYGVYLALGTLAAAVSTTALARVDVDLNVGTPAPVYVAPPPPPPPAVVYEQQPAVVVAQPAIVIGWHGDRYWDGHRYWARDEWNRNHPPHHDEHHDNHHDNHHDDHHDDHHG
jgi:hypothetical protein